MSHDDFVKLVLDANLDTFFTNTLVLKKLKKFAESVESTEREACAKLCEEYDVFGPGTRERFAEAIRGRK